MSKDNSSKASPSTNRKWIPKAFRDDKASSAIWAVAFFLKSKGTVNGGFYAMNAIRKLAAAGGSIPPALIPYIDQACEAWEDSRRSRVSKFKTEQTRAEAVAMMAALREKANLTVSDAAAYVHQSYPTLSVETLLQYWSRGRYKEAKEIGIKLSGVIPDP